MRVLLWSCDRSTVEINRIDRAVMENMVSEVSEASTRKDGESKAAGLQVASGSDGAQPVAATCRSDEPLSIPQVQVGWPPVVGPLDKILISTYPL